MSNFLFAEDAFVPEQLCSGRVDLDPSSIGVQMTAIE